MITRVTKPNPYYITMMHCDMVLTYSKSSILLWTLKPSTWYFHCPKIWILTKQPIIRLAELKQGLADVSIMNRNYGKFHFGDWFPVPLSLNIYKRIQLLIMEFESFFCYLTQRSLNYQSKSMKTYKFNLGNLPKSSHWVSLRD